MLALALIALGAWLLVASQLPSPIECVSEYDQPSDAIRQQVMAARDELRSRGYDANASGERLLTLRAEVEPELLSLVGLSDESNGPQLEAAMADLIGMGRPTCFQEPVYD